MTDHADLTARRPALRDAAHRGSWMSSSVVLELLDALDAADAENARLRAERSAALALLDIHAKDPFHPDVRAALRAVLAVSEEATDAEGGPRG